MVLHETGQVEAVDCVRSTVAYAAPPNEAVLADNPLGKLPTLVLDDGTALFDSRVICEYLDGLHDGPHLLPRKGPARFRQLRWQALGDGMTDIMLLWRNELMRPGGPHQVLPAAFTRKLQAAMARLDAEADQLTAEPFGLGQIAVLCAIGQLDFRFGGSRWTGSFPALAAWHAGSATRPCVTATEVQDDPSPVTPAAGFDPTVSPIDFMNGL